MVVNFKLIFNLFNILFEQLLLIGNIINYFEWKKERYINIICLISNFYATCSLDNIFEDKLSDL